MSVWAVQERGESEEARREADTGQKEGEKDKAGPCTWLAQWLATLPHPHHPPAFSSSPPPCLQKPRTPTLLAQNWCRSSLALTPPPRFTSQAKVEIP